MNKSKFFSLVFIFTAPLLIFVLYWMFFRPPSSFRGVSGPTTDILITEGVFKPGGYIDFKLSPNIKSTEGLYDAHIYTYAVKNSFENIDDSLWPMVHQQQYPKKWGNTLMGGSKIFSIKHRVWIPTDPLLSGKSIVFKLKYSIRFPTTLATNVFSNSNKEIKQTIEIDLENKQLTSEEIDWLENKRSQHRIIEEIIGATIIFLGFFWLYSVLIFIGVVKK